LEPLKTVGKYFESMKQFINKFPTINILQIHKYHSPKLLDSEAYDIEYFLKARKIVEDIYSRTNMRPLVWENYISLWFLKFEDEILMGTRTP